MSSPASANQFLIALQVTKEGLREGKKTRRGFKEGVTSWWIWRNRRRRVGACAPGSRATWEGPWRTQRRRSRRRRPFASRRPPPWPSNRPNSLARKRGTGGWKGIRLITDLHRRDSRRSRGRTESEACSSKSSTAMARYKSRGDGPVDGFLGFIRAWWAYSVKNYCCKSLCTVCGATNPT